MGPCPSRERVTREKGTTYDLPGVVECLIGIKQQIHESSPVAEKKLRDAWERVIKLPECKQRTGLQKSVIMWMISNNHLDLASRCLLEVSEDDSMLVFCQIKSRRVNMAATI